jgi:hypothetical protein
MGLFCRPAVCGKSGQGPASVSKAGSMGKCGGQAAGGISGHRYTLPEWKKMQQDDTEFFRLLSREAV